MRLRSRLAISCVGLAAGSVLAVAQTPTVAEEIEALKKRIAELEARQQLEKSIDAAKSDAKRRDAIAGGASLSYDRGFTLTSDDGNFKFTPNIEFQLRYLLNSLDGEQEIRDGFDIRRANLVLRGHAFSPDLRYFCKWITNRDGGGVTLESFYGQYKLNDQFQVRFGQWLSDVHRESEVPSPRQMAADRSLINDFLGQGDLNVQQGVQLRYESDAEKVRGFVGFTDGQNSGNTPFTDAGSNYGLQAKISYKFFGDWKEYVDSTALGIKQQLLVASVGMDYSENDAAPGATDQSTVGVYRHTIDITFKDPGGLSVLGVYYGRFIDASDDQSYDWGLLSQVAYVILNTKWEPFGQVSLFALDNEPAAVAQDTYYVITLGTNYYYMKQNAKFTVDLSFLPKGSPKSSTSSGVFASNEFQAVLRTQFQLQF